MLEEILSKIRDLDDGIKEQVAAQAGSWHFGNGSLSE